MRFVAYEWCCSGGHVEPAPSSSRFHGEGRAMLEAIAADAARDPSLDVAVLLDERPSGPSARDGIRLAASVRRVPVRRGCGIDALLSAARDADWTLIVAPETDGILASIVAAVRAAGGMVLAADDAFLEIAADKQTTIDSLAAAGVAVPAGRSLAPLENVPPGFPMPAVRKHRHSAGGDGLSIVRSANVARFDAPSRLEPLVEGTHVGVGVLCGPTGLWPMPPMRQRFSDGDSPRYLGGEPLQNCEAAERAVRLATRAIAAVTRAAAIRGPAGGRPCGWVGVDMILGARDDAEGDRVLEVNPRLTTSFVGLSAAQEKSLVSEMVAVAEGRRAATDRFDWKPGAAFSIE